MIEVSSLKIVRKKSGGSYQFEVLRSFTWGGYTTEVGQVLQMGEPMATEYVVARRVSPILPPEIECIALCDLSQPGNEKAYKAKRFEKVLLRKEQFLELALQRQVVPVDPAIWRPYGMQLRHPLDAVKERKEREAYEQEIFEQKIWEQGIHPAQKHK